MQGLVADGLAMSYAGRRVVDGVSLSVPPGNVVGLLGPNGAGKTTCFRMICGLVIPEGGTVSLDGAALGRLPLHRRVRMGLGYLPQEPSVFRRQSAWDNLHLALRSHRRSRAEGEALLTELGLSKVAGTAAGKLSGGERRRLEIARALAGQPRVLLLDEPFSALDAVTRFTLQDEFRSLRDHLGTTVVLVTHDLFEAFGLGHRIGVMHEGRLEQVGRASELQGSPATAYVEALVDQARRQATVLETMP